MNIATEVSCLKTRMPNLSWAPPKDKAGNAFAPSHDNSDRTKALRTFRNSTVISFLLLKVKYCNSFGGNHKVAMVATEIMVLPKAASPNKPIVLLPKMAGYIQHWRKFRLSASKERSHLCQSGWLSGNANPPRPQGRPRTGKPGTTIITMGSIFDMGIDPLKQYTTSTYAWEHREEP